MMWLRDLWRRVRGVYRAEAIHREIAEEMSFHVEMRTAENIRRGMSPEEAQKDAERSFGRLTRLKEQGYEVRGGRWLETLFRDVRYALRVLRRDAGLATFAVLIVGLGVGASSTVFSVVNALLLRPLPFENAERLVWIRNGGGG